MQRSPTIGTTTGLRLPLYAACVAVITAALLVSLTAPEWHANAITRGGCLLAGLATIVALKTFPQWHASRPLFWALTGVWVAEWIALLVIRSNLGLL